MRLSHEIYIPIWLDLLWEIKADMDSLLVHLHSNMVRFIINWTEARFFSIKEFTFQYG